MAQIIVTYDDSLDTRVKAAIAGQYKRPDQVRDATGALIPNPVSVDDFATNVVNAFVKEVVIGYEATIAATAAQQASISKGMTEVHIGAVVQATPVTPTPVTTAPNA